MTDVLGRSWQMGTIQLDSQMPARFGLTYVGEDNAEHTPYVVHRALFGSLERFMGILIEHYAGAFPVWLAPVQVRVIPVGEDHREAAQALAGKLGEFRIEVDDSDETVGKRIRNAEVEKIPYVVVWGDKESEGAIAVREHGESSPRRVSTSFWRSCETLLGFEACKAGATCSSPPGPRACRGFNREGWEGSGRCCAAVLLFEEGGS